MVNCHRRFGCLQLRDQIITVLRNVAIYFPVLRGINESLAAATFVVLLSGHNSPTVHKIPNVQPAQQQPQCSASAVLGVECCAGQVAANPSFPYVRKCYYIDTCIVKPYGMLIVKNALFRHAVRASALLCRVSCNT